MGGGPPPLGGGGPQQFQKTLRAEERKHYIIYKESYTEMCEIWFRYPVVQEQN